MPTGSSMRGGQTMISHIGLVDEPEYTYIVGKGGSLWSTSTNHAQVELSGGLIEEGKYE